ncbi:hypothetical protein JI735_27515 [Paenibacillus sonchi]|uniref:Uncharacterized protein n=1 Tax=Paenibacillus sonchi TaxID=373687 RepID=A0A974PBA7_9BACL|nr:hypothetical protein [Paenibacillus sonchi]QQZ60233.1 hypothetical protein JI735_27515 [Paenibacillus sonchi]
MQTEKLQQMQYWAQCSIKILQEYAPYLNIDDQQYITYPNHFHIRNNSKGYYLYTVLEEIAMVGSSMFRWIDFLSGDDPVDLETFPTRVIIQAVSDEQSMWNRKLLEALVDLILFDKTNDENYFKHYLLMREYNDIQMEINDWKEFYGHPFENHLLQLAETKKTIQLFEPEIDFNKCWYLQEKKSINSPKYPYSPFKSFRQKLKEALIATNAREKLVLGLSYKRYSDTSESIHFIPDKKIDLPSTITIEKTMMKIWLTIVCLIGRVQTILGDCPKGFDDEINTILNLPTNEQELINLLIVDRFQINDIILTSYSDLAVVTDTFTSKYGYKTYKIKFLIKEQSTFIKEEWFPGNYMKKIIGYSEIMTHVLSNPDLAPLFETVSTEEYYKQFVNTFVDTWNLGAKDYFLRNDKDALFKSFMKLDIK